MIGAGECPIARVDFAGIAEIFNTRDGEMISTQTYADHDKLSASVLSLPPRTRIFIVQSGVLIHRQRPAIHQRQVPSILTQSQQGSWRA
jgi:hypothetical protein